PPAGRVRRGVVMPVYFIQAGEDGPVKIGWAADPVARLGELQVGNHLELRIIRTIDGPPIAERVLHDYFGHRRIRGEWFSFDQEMLEVELSTVARELREKASKKLAHADALEAWW